jgi:hypothetical protein
MNDTARSGFSYGSVGSFGGIVLALFLILFGLGLLINLGIPAWVTACFALLAGVLILVGR